MSDKKFLITRASGYKVKEYERVIHTIEDLRKLYKEFGGHSLIIDFTENFDRDQIMIYDDYIE